MTVACVRVHVPPRGCCSVVACGSLLCARNVACLRFRSARGDAHMHASFFQRFSRGGETGLRTSVRSEARGCNTRRAVLKYSSAGCPHTAVPTVATCAPGKVMRRSTAARRGSRSNMTVSRQTSASGFTRRLASGRSSLPTGPPQTLVYLYSAADAWSATAWLGALKMCRAPRGRCRHARERGCRPRRMAPA